ncbi:Glycosyltransferase involved in cell wall bisynthesis [Geodermatophilus obscurus]|uniref:Glycosyltransferase involved in cell wall bisynthesis n=1 Tax=Geodermatophilus obscurus TaxID=1861 RepID=A0A1M7UQL2_9ACTN|nr:glycosyltransferase family 4 protein [Geodermatophilus obscurus]SHN85230.1 Glycosyltransferase involved in cell wall bisynthesis [Geodermatophilus obscurus]
MRALIAAPFYPPHPGGIERHSAGVAAELRRRGWEVDVVHCVTEGEAAGRALGPNGERLLALESRLVGGRLPFPRRTERNAAVIDEIRETSYDFVLIQSHLFVSNLVVARAVGSAPRIWLNHGSAHVATGHPVVDRCVAAYEHVLAGRLRRVVPTVAGVSTEAAAWVSHMRVDAGSSVGNAVARVSPPRRGRREGPLRVVSVGRLEPAKGALEAVRVVDGLPASAEVELTVCGGGSIAARVAREARASRRRIVTTGPVPHEEVQARLVDADVLLLLSDSEGFPTVLLEAGAAGCAVITHPVGGTAEVLRDGGGWRVADVQAAAARLGELAARPQLATEAGEVLRRTVESTYTWPPVVDRLLRLAGVRGEAAAPSCTASARS